MARKRPTLDVWLYGHHVARLTEPSRYRYRFSFTQEGLDIFGDQSRVLSLSLPLSSRPVTDGSSGHWPVSAFLEGLLPEGNVRAQVASTYKILSIDKMALLSKVGAECAGAVQFLPEDVRPTSGHVRRLDDQEVDRLVSDLPTYHLPEGAEPQASLAGIQDKVLLTRLDDGGWGWPEGGAVSTHIIKPEPTGGSTLPHLIQTEDWALKVAHEAGLAAAKAQLADFSGRTALVVDRYDRARGGTRVHQEDFCQALGLEPNAKYESTTEYEQQGSRLSRLADLAAPRSDDPTRFRLDLLKAVTYNVAIGNGDAHSKNYSLLLDSAGRVALAPLYDTAPVMHINGKFKSTGHVLAGQTNIDWVNTEVLISEAQSWGLARKLASRAVIETMERIHAAAEIVDMPEGTDAVLASLRALWVRQSWPVAGSVAHSDSNQAAHELDVSETQAVPGHSAACRSPDPENGRVWVAEYTNKRGTLVAGHWRTRSVRGRR